VIFFFVLVRGSGDLMLTFMINISILKNEAFIISTE